MILLKPLAVAFCTAITALNTRAESVDDDLPTLHFFDEDFAPRLAPKEDILDSLVDTRIPRKCRDDIKEGKSNYKECNEWMKANPGFTIPTQEPTMEPTPFFHVSSSFKDDTVMEVKLKPTDDTFIEVWRNKEALGSKEKLKIEKKFKELEERCDLQVKEIFALRKVVSVYPEMRDKYCQTFF